MNFMNNDPSQLKNLEKEFAKEGKSEESRLKYAMRDFQSLEKDAKKATKNSDRAERMFSRSEKEEHSTTKALNKATHNHDLAVSNLHATEQNVDLERKGEAKVKDALQKKEAEVQGMMNAQQERIRERESTLSEIHDARAHKPAETSPTSTTTESRPEDVVPQGTGAPTS